MSNLSKEGSEEKGGSITRREDCISPKSGEPLDFTSDSQITLTVKDEGLDLETKEIKEERYNGIFITTAPNSESKKIGWK